MYSMGPTKSSLKNITNGVKQGSVISPRMFTIYIDQLLLRLNKSGIDNYVGYDVIYMVNTWRF